MNETEKIAYKYLLSLGYADSDIRYHTNISPDFVTRDGKRWEVKKGSDKRRSIAIFTNAQLLTMNFNLWGQGVENSPSVRWGMNRTP